MPWYRLFRRETHDGIHVIVCNVPYSGHFGALGRMWSFIWFAVVASFAVLLAPRPDVVFATHTPLTVGIPGYVGARLRRVGFIFEVRDLWPESDVIAGHIRQGSLLERSLNRLERFLYVKADRILLVSPGFERRLIEQGWPARKLKTILLGADGEIFRDLREDTEFRKAHGLEGKTVAVYTGAHGIANGLNYVIDAAEILKDRQDIAFVLIGDGNRKRQLVDQAREKGLTNVLFLDYMPKTNLPGILASCDIGLMILANVGYRPVTPNKIFDYMFAGLPSVVNFSGPTLDMLIQDGTGVFADPTKPAELAEKVTYWADHPEEAGEIGRRARKMAYEKYERQQIAEQLCEEFRKMVRDCRGGATANR